MHQMAAVVLKNVLDWVNDMSFDIERNFSAPPAIEWTGKNFPLAVASVIIYLMAIKIGTVYMAKFEKPFDLKYILAAWNAFLCIFSFVGMCKTVRYIFYTFVRYEMLI